MGMVRKSEKPDFLLIRRQPLSMHPEQLELTLSCHIFDIDYNCCFVAEHDVEDGYKHHLIEVWPLNMLSSDEFRMDRCFFMD